MAELDVAFNPLDMSSLITLSNDNLTATIGGSGSTVGSVRATEGKTEGKWYWEYTIKKAGAMGFGIMMSNATLTGDNYLLCRAYTHHPYKSNGSSIVSYGKAITTGNIISVLLDLDNYTIEFWHNGISQGVAFTDLNVMGEVYAFVGGQKAVVDVNFGSSEFNYPIPEGYESYGDSTKKILMLKSNNKFYSLQSNEILHETKMTSNTTPAPFVASASSIYGSAHPVWKAFNGTNNHYQDCWATANNTVSGWVQIDFGTKRKTNILKLTSRNSDGVTTNQYPKESFPKDIVIYGSDGNSSFTVIKKFYDLSVEGSNETITLFLPYSNYRYYKLEILNNNGNQYYTTIGEILYSYIEGLIQLPSDSVENFINYGTSSIENFNLINTNKKYILQDTVSENEKGLWVQDVNRKPLSIKFKERK